MEYNCPITTCLASLWAVLQRLRHVRRLDLVTARQIGNRAR